MPLPTFVIAGAQKCGTSSLGATLRRHPQAYVAPGKELHFFNRDHGQGLDAYAERFTPAPHHRAWGEATPAYIYDADARRRMCEALPEARIVVILRDPVQRAYSHYWHSRRIKVERLDTFEAALDAEPARLTGTPGARMHGSYVDRGHYIDQLESLTAQHDPGLVHVMLFDDLKGDRTAALRGLFGFLGIDEEPADSIEEQWKNRYRVRTDGGKPVPTSYPPLDPETRARLVEHFGPSNARLATWLGRDLSAWDRVRPAAEPSDASA